MAIAPVINHLLGDAAPIRIRAYDGSRSGPADAPVLLDVRSERALSYLATGGGEMGLARAYTMGDLEVEGDLYTAMAGLTDLGLAVPWTQRLRALRSLGGVRLLRPPPRPAQEVRLRGRR